MTRHLCLISFLEKKIIVIVTAQFISLVMGRPFSKFDVMMSCCPALEVQKPKPALHRETDCPNLGCQQCLAVYVAYGYCRTVCQTSHMNSMRFPLALYKICLRQHLDWWTALSSETFPLMKTLRGLNGDPVELAHC